MKNVTAPQAELGLKRARRMNLLVQHQLAEAGRVVLDHIKHSLERGFLQILRQVGIDMLAE